MRLFTSVTLLCVFSVLPGCGIRDIGPLGISRSGDAIGSVRLSIVEVEGVDLAVSEGAVRAASVEGVSVVNARACEFAELVFGDQLQVPVSCSGVGGSITMISSGGVSQRMFELAVLALRAGGATVTITTGLVSVVAPEGDNEERRDVTAIEAPSGDFLVDDSGADAAAVPSSPRGIQFDAGRSVLELSGDAENLRSVASSLGVAVDVFGVDGRAFAVGRAVDLRLLQQSVQGLGDAAVSIPMVHFDESVAEVLRVGSVRLSFDADASRLLVAGDPVEVADVIRLARGLFPDVESRFVRVAFVTGSVDRVLRLSADAGGVLRAGSGVVSFGTAATDFDLALDALRSDAQISTDDRPVIRILDGREASLRVVLSVPVIGALGENGEQEVEYRDAGTILTVRAVPEFGDVIRLELRIEVSAVQGTGVLENPNFASNIVETTVLVRENEPVLLSGFQSSAAVRNRALSLARPGVERSRSRVEQHLLVTVY
jgi:hypothetical protein